MQIDSLREEALNQIKQCIHKTIAYQMSKVPHVFCARLDKQRRRKQLFFVSRLGYMCVIGTGSTFKSSDISLIADFI